MSTLLLDRTVWDLLVDTSGNIAVASEPYSISQDVSSAARLFLGELWYNTSLGIPYDQIVLGKAPSLQVLKSLIANAALTVPGVAQAQVFVSAFTDRRVTGQIRITTTAGAVLNAGF